ncbi:MAG: methyltransferase [Deltaproteobacteria bacterium]|nr:MAG: methyltransferase [Deltaproteobacteria bacterium]
MTLFAPPATNFGPLYRMVDDFFHAPLLVTAINLRVFEKTTVPLSAGDIAAQAGWHPENTERFLNALVAADLLEKQHGKFCNTLLSKDFLVESSATYLGDFLEQSFAMVPQDSQTLAELIRQGPPDMPSQEENKEQHIETHAEESIHTLARMERALCAQLTAYIADLPEFPRMKKMLDLGGGPGLYCMSLVSAHPTLQGTVFDFPAVTKYADRYIEEYGMADRVTTLSGDFTRDDLGCGYDMVLATGTLNFSKAFLEQIMGKICKALAPGGICVSLHDQLNPDGAGPAVSVRRYLPMALAGNDFYLEAGSIAQAMSQAGFQSVVSRSIESPFGPAQLDIGRVP